MLTLVKIPREILPKLEKWIDRRKAFAIKGPRQSGKTTLLKIIQERLTGNDKEVIFLNFEDSDIMEAFEKKSQAIHRELLDQRTYFLMDEYHLPITLWWSRETSGRRKR